MKRKIITLLISFCLLFEQSGLAQVAGPLVLPAFMGGFTAVDTFRPEHLRSISYEPLENNFKTLLDKGTARENDPIKEQNSTRELFKYFFIGLSLPNDSFWVNLRPDSADNIIDEYLAKTDIGKIMLEADVQLKKDTAKYTSPDTAEGKIYWDKLYRKAQELFASENISIPTLTRPWIVPDEIILRQSKDDAYIYKATLKVMLEADYLKDSAQYSFNDPRLKELNDYSSQLIREFILPKLTRDVNTCKRYASLRQVYFSLILAQWFKNTSQVTGHKSQEEYGLLFSKIDSRDLNGLTSPSRWTKDTYFKEYQKSFNNGEYNKQENVQSIYGISLRQYFSGGVKFGGIAESIVPNNLVNGNQPGNFGLLKNTVLKMITIAKNNFIEIKDVQPEVLKSGGLPLVGNTNLPPGTSGLDSADGGDNSYESAVNQFISAARSYKSSFRGISGGEIKSLTKPWEDARAELVRLGGPVVKYLRSYLKDKDKKIKAQVAYLLGEIDGAEVVPSLIGLIEDETKNDKDSLVVNAAFEGLLKVGEPAVPALIELLNNDDPLVSRDAVAYLGRIGSAAAVPGLIVCLQSHDLEMICRAAQALVEINDPPGLKALEEFIKAVEEKGSEYIVSDELAKLKVRIVELQEIRQTIGAGSNARKDGGKDDEDILLQGAVTKKEELSGFPGRTILTVRSLKALLAVLEQAPENSVLYIDIDDTLFSHVGVYPSQKFAAKRLEMKKKSMSGEEFRQNEQEIISEIIRECIHMEELGIEAGVFQIVPGADELLKTAKKKGIRVVVITNRPERLKAITERELDSLKIRGFEKIYFAGFGNGKAKEVRDEIEQLKPQEVFFVDNNRENVELFSRQIGDVRLQAFHLENPDEQKEYVQSYYLGELRKLLSGSLESRKKRAMAELLLISAVMNLSELAGDIQKARLKDLRAIIQEFRPMHQGFFKTANIGKYLEEFSVRVLDSREKDIKGFIQERTHNADQERVDLASDSPQEAALKMVKAAKNAEVVVVAPGNMAAAHWRALQTIHKFGKVAEEINKLLPGGGSADLKYYLHELFKNAFYHGNKLDFDLPVYFYFSLNKNGNMENIEVYDNGAKEFKYLLDKYSLQEKEVVGEGLGVQDIFMDGLEYERFKFSGFPGSMVRVRVDKNPGNYLSEDGLDQADGGLAESLMMSDYLKTSGANPEALYFRNVLVLRREQAVEELKRRYPELKNNNELLGNIYDYLKLLPDNSLKITGKLSAAAERLTRSLAREPLFLDQLLSWNKSQSEEENILLRICLRSLMTTLFSRIEYFHPEYGLYSAQMRRIHKARLVILSDREWTSSAYLVDTDLLGEIKEFYSTQSSDSRSSELFIQILMHEFGHNVLNGIIRTQSTLIGNPNVKRLGLLFWSNTAYSLKRLDEFFADAVALKLSNELRLNSQQYVEFFKSLYEKNKYIRDFSKAHLGPRYLFFEWYKAEDLQKVIEGLQLSRMAGIVKDLIPPSADWLDIFGVEDRSLLWEFLLKLEVFQPGDYRRVTEGFSEWYHDLPIAMPEVSGRADPATSADAILSGVNGKVKTDNGGQADGGTVEVNVLPIFHPSRRSEVMGIFKRILDGDLDPARLSPEEFAVEVETVLFFDCLSKKMAENPDYDFEKDESNQAGKESLTRDFEEYLSKEGRLDHFIASYANLNNIGGLQLYAALVQIRDRLKSIKFRKLQYESYFDRRLQYSKKIASSDLAVRKAFFETSTEAKIFSGLSGASDVKRLVALENKIKRSVRKRQKQDPGFSKEVISQYYGQQVEIDNYTLDWFLDLGAGRVEQQIKVGLHEEKKEQVTYQGTEYDLIRNILRSSQLKLRPEDVIYDLGSGYGRMVFYAALTQPVKKTVGIEYVPERVQRCRQVQERLGLANVEFRQERVQDADFQDGTVFYLFNPFTAETLNETGSKLKELAKRKEIRIIATGICADYFRQQGWLVEQAEIESSWPVVIFRSFSGASNARAQAAESLDGGAVQEILKQNLDSIAVDNFGASGAVVDAKKAWKIFRAKDNGEVGALSREFARQIAKVKSSELSESTVNGFIDQLNEEDTLDKEADFLVFASEQGEVQGIMSMRAPGFVSARLSELWVIPGLRDEDIGTKLLDTFFRILDERNSEQVYIDSLLTALGFYKKYLERKGITPGYYEIGLPHSAYKAVDIRITGEGIKKIAGAIRADGGAVREILKQNLNAIAVGDFGVSGTVVDAKKAWEIFQERDDGKVGVLSREFARQVALVRPVLRPEFEESMVKDVISQLNGEKLEDKETDFYIFVNAQGAIQGIMRMHLLKPALGELIGLAVVPELQRKNGIGTMLLDTFFQVLRDQGVKEAVIPTDPGATGFYGKYLERRGASTQDYEFDKNHAYNNGLSFSVSRSTIEKIASSAEKDGGAAAPGGIDLRRLPIKAETQASLPNEVSSNTAQGHRLDSQWQDIQELVNKGFLPESGRIKECFLYCKAGGVLPAKIESMLSCLEEILRIEEDLYLPTDPTLKEFLVLLESG